MEGRGRIRDRVNISLIMCISLSNKSIDPAFTHMKFNDNHQLHRIPLALGSGIGKLDVMALKKKPYVMFSEDI